MHKKLFIPGPVDVRPEVLAKMSTPMISHRGKAATELGKDVCTKLQKVFQLSLIHIYVESVTVQFFGQTLSESCCSPGSEMRLVGFDPKTDWIVTPWLQKNLKHELADDEIIIGSRVTGFEDGTGYIRGRAVRVAGVMDQTGSSFDLCVFMNIDVVRDIMALSLIHI